MITKPDQAQDPGVRDNFKKIYSPEDLPGLTGDQT